MKLLTVNDVCDILQLKASTVYKLAGGEIPVVRIGGSIRFTEEDVYAYVSSCRSSSQVSSRPRRRPKLKHLHPS